MVGDPRSSQRGVGCLVGGGVGAVWLVALFGLYEADARRVPGGLQWVLFVLWLAFTAAAYLVAIVLTRRRSTHLFGQGMLLGLITVLLAVIAVVFLQGVFTPS